MKQIFNIDEFKGDSIYLSLPEDEDNKVFFLEYKNKYLIDEYGKTTYEKSLFKNMKDSIIGSFHCKMKVYELTEQEFEKQLMLYELRK